MPNTSKKTYPVALRIPMDVYKIIERRVGRRPDKWGKPVDYIREQIVFHVRRKHN